ncbi:T9SS C-terminal target domain-containing protein [Chryseobacterium nematophagum]|uniref:T9SS C-terminal target domain-containing protein n=1 Tax=Chryseobacterium nematophagum TaxID=2305228 RepID=A0A3M7TCW8_9FLAO|nr:T9SS type A sorting domain-containing protein [Chryseobacterium nematophagum]RNA61321.1 T9SS C-terminal target domain-containing protein [Chryseobacterium nematophagum]
MKHITISLFMIIGGCTQVFGQTYFTQDFSSSNVVSDYATGAANRFNAINISSGIAAANWSIDTGALKFDKLGLGRDGYLTKTDFATSANTALLKFSYKLSAVIGLTSVASIYVGDNFTTTASVPTAANTYAQVNMYNLLLGTGLLIANQYVNISLYINRSATSIKYLGPNGVLQTLATGSYDIWANTSKGTSGSAVTSSIPLSDFKIVSSQNVIGSASFDNFSVTAIPHPATVWNGSSWSTSPTVDYDATIDGNYSGAGFTSSSLTINSNNTFSPSGATNTGNVVNNGNITLGSGQSVVQSAGSTYTGSGNITLNNGGAYTLGVGGTYSGSGNIIVNSGGAYNLGNNSNYAGSGSVTINDGGNFIQGTGSTYNGTGMFAVNKNNGAQVNKYVFWGVPITQRNVHTLYTGYTSQYAMTYNTATNYYNTLPNPTISSPGYGYSIKIPNGAAPINFTGEPNNGDINVPLTIASLNYNLVGNPYPSNVNLRNFYLANQSVIGSTLWFWDSSVNPVITQNGNTSQNHGYSTYNALSQTWVGAPTASTPTNTTAKIGQGWMVKASSAGNVVFNNSMRESSTGASYNKMNLADNEGKYWLRLTTPNKTFNTQAIIYTQGASQAYDAYDSKALGVGPDAFYSLVDNEKVIIQGRNGSFDIDDRISLGSKFRDAGSFTISLEGTEGLFSNGQAIYLYDKKLGKYVDLHNESYTFLAEAGEEHDRFEIVYKQELFNKKEHLVEATNTEVKVYRVGDEFVVSSAKNIESVDVVDGSGRVVNQIKGTNKQEVRFGIASGVYLLKVKIDNQIITRKIVK